MKIAMMLDLYAEKMRQIESINKEIDSVAHDLLVREKELSKEADKLKAEIKDTTKFIPESKAHTLLGKFFQLVWKPGSTTWNTVELEKWIESAGLSEEQTAGILACKETGKGKTLP
jgi:hypothetical protein